MTSMKTLPLISALAAALALVVVPTPAVAGTLFFAVSLITIFASDYSRIIQPLTPRASVLAFKPASAVQTCEQAA